MRNELPAVQFDESYATPGILDIASQPHLLSANTLRAYQSDIKHYRAWCDEHNLEPFDDEAEVLARYLTELSETHSVGTLKRRLSAIRFAYEYSWGTECPLNLTDPFFAPTWKRICRTRKRRGKSARPLSPQQLRTMLRSMFREPFPSQAQAWRRSRDRALLCLGFAAGLRRSELVALRRQDLEFEERGLLVKIGPSKTDQLGEGCVVGLKWGHGLTCPVDAARTWLHEKGSRGDVLFPNSQEVDSPALSGRSVGNILKMRMLQANLDPDGYSAHSLRAGMVTQAYRGGASDFDIARISRHRCPEVLRSYIREIDPWTNNPTHLLDL